MDLRIQRYRDRRDAGEMLAQELRRYAGRSDVVVLALPRGGVPIGYEIATRLDLPLDVLVVRKLGVPGHSELAMGAIASGGIEVADRTILSALRVSSEDFARVLVAERAELERREQLFRSDRPALEVGDKVAILVDDGLATGATMRAAVESLRLRDPAGIVVAVPVGSPETCDALRPRVDEVVCLLQPAQLYGVGLWYADFSQTTDTEVRMLLDAAARAREAQDRERVHPQPHHEDA
jgi:putative phosphoribosyl transferase